MRETYLLTMMGITLFGVFLCVFKYIVERYISVSDVLRFIAFLLLSLGFYLFYLAL